MILTDCLIKCQVQLDDNKYEVVLTLDTQLLGWLSPLR